MHKERGVLLKDLTTFHTGGAADYVVRAHSPEMLAQAYAFAAQHGLPVLVLGGGSNVLLPDEPFHGLVIKIEIPGMLFTEDGAGGVLLTAGAGEVWDDVAAASVARGLYGIENLSGIPGTAGAAPMQNIGAYGAELADVLEWVEVFDVRDGSVKKLSAADCDFGYRTSIFKKEAGAAFVVTRIALHLQKDGAARIDYQDLARWFAGTEPTLPAVREAVLAIRATKFPHGEGIGTAGSFFKNPIVSGEHARKLKTLYPDLPVRDVSQTERKLSAAWLIEHVGGLKGVRRGSAGISQDHALVMVTYGADARAADVESLAREIEHTIDERTDIKLVREVNRVSYKDEDDAHDVTRADITKQTT